MNTLEAPAGPLPGQEVRQTLRIPKYDRTIYDFIIIAACYLFMPLGLILAGARFISSHFKNYRKSSNYTLLFHAFVGGFIEMVGFIIFDFNELTFDTGTLVGVLITFGLIFLLPASFFANRAAKARFQFTQLANQYVRLITAGGVFYIGNLSDRTGQSEADVRRDVKYLMNHGVLGTELVFPEGHSVDSAPHSFSGRGSTQSASAGGQTWTSAQPVTPPSLPKSVRCPGCGAQNTVSPGQSKSCDYCGTTLAYN